jgi:tetratricopeptide (TPR) repeat protein
VDALPAGEQAQDARLGVIAALAVTLREQGEMDAALAAHAEAVALAETLYGPSHPSLATELNNAGAARLQQGDLAESEVLLRRALEIRKASFAPTHVAVLEGQINLAIALDQLRRHDEAAPLLEAAASHAEHAEAKVRVELYMLLGGVHMDQGLYEEAEAEFQRGLAEARATWEPDDSRVLRVIANAANLANRRELHAEAEQLAREGLAGMAGSTREGLGLPEGYLMLNLGDALASQGRHAEARPAFATALARMEANLGPEHPHLQAPLVGLATCMLEVGEAEQALPLLRRALTMVGGLDAHTRGATRFAMARAQWALGEREQARAQAQQAILDYEDARPHNREQIAEWLRTHPP